MSQLSGTVMTDELPETDGTIPDSQLDLRLSETIITVLYRQSKYTLSTTDLSVLDRILALS